MPRTSKSTDGLDVGLRGILFKFASQRGWFNREVNDAEKLSSKLLQIYEQWLFYLFIYLFIF